MTSTQFQFSAIGTQWTIDIHSPAKSEKNQHAAYHILDDKKLLRDIKKRIEIFDKTYSRFRKDSIITEISKKKGVFTLPDDAKKLFHLYKNIYNATKGAVTPLIGQALSDAGYDTEYSLKTKRLKSVPNWEDVLEYKYPKLIVTKPVLLDFGAAGKGYLVDIIADILKKNEINDFCIDAGGDILQNSLKNETLKVGLEHPSDQTQVIGIADIKNQSICGSSGNRRKWGKFHHIISPFTLSSPRNILSVWAIADTAVIADGMTTSLFFEPGEKLKKLFDFEYLVLFDDLSYEISSNFPAELYTNIGAVSN